MLSNVQYICTPDYVYYTRVRAMVFQIVVASESMQKAIKYMR